MARMGTGGEIFVNGGRGTFLNGEKGHKKCLPAMQRQSYYSENIWDGVLCDYS